MQRVTSGAGQNTAVPSPNIRVHHHLQHHLGSAPDILGHTGNFHEHLSHSQFQHPTSLSPIHSLHDAHLRRSPIRNCFRSTCKANHQKRLRNLSSPENRHGTLHRHFLNGFRCNHRTQEKNLRSQPQPKALHLLDSSPVSDIRAFRNVHSSGVDRILLQTVNTGDAVFLDSNDLLFLLVWILSELPFGFFRQQSKLDGLWGWVAERQRPQQRPPGPLLLATGRAKPHQFLQLSILVKMVFLQSICNATYSAK